MSVLQSCSAFVYVFSVLILKEKVCNSFVEEVLSSQHVFLHNTAQVTLLKTSAVLCSIGGVVMVSTATPTTTRIEPSTVGYLWLMASVTTFALYEVRAP